MKSLCLVSALLFLVAPSAWAAEGTVGAKKPNVLFLVADDLNCDLGVYGATFARTPNLDALAKRSVRFERAYTQFPHCSPSRSSFLTGRRPNVTGVYGNPAPQHPLGPHFRDKIPTTVTLPQLFKEHGWFSARVGKLFHYGVPLDIGTASLDDFYSWDLAINPRGRDRDNLDDVFSLIPGRFGGVLSWLKDEEGSGAEQTDGIGADEAIKLLKRFRREERPFFLAVGFYRPHTPYVAPAEYFAMHPIESIDLPKLSADDRARQPALAYATARPEQDTMTDAQRREAIQAYRASTSFMDAQVGRVLAALESSGLAENTIVIFTSDHGYHLGDHGLWQKVSLFERSTRVPLFISAPGAKGHGRTAGGVTALLDLYPTLAELCGLPAPDYLDGVSLRAMLDDPAARSRSHALSQVRRRAPDRMGYAVRTERWRYVEWDGAPEESQLFDMENDPGETTNRVRDTGRAALVAELHAIVEQERVD